MKNKLLALVGCAMLSACIHQVPIPDASKDMAQLDAAAQSRCAKSGYQPGTPDFNNCVYGVKSSFLQAVMVPVGPVPDVRPLPPAPPPIQTHCYTSGSTTNCTSY